MKTENTRSVVEVTLIVVAIVGVAMLAWQLASVLLLFFAAVLIAVILRGVADLIERVLPVRGRFSLALAIIAITLVVAGAVTLLGVQIAEQFGALAQTLPDIIAAIGDQFGIEDIGGVLLEQAQMLVSAGGVMGNIAIYTTGLLGAFGSLLLVVATAIFLAAGAEGYRDGLIRLLPKAARPRVRNAVDKATRALRLWLFAQLILMLIVGVATGAALQLLGVPSALALGLIAGVMEFIPFFGPVLGAVPGVAVALAQDDPYLVFWVIGAYLVIQQLESNFLIPVVQQRTVELPPALALFSIVAFASLFGVLGILLSVPLAVVGMVFVNQLYIRDTLKDDIYVPGERKAETKKSEEAKVEKPPD